MCAASRRRARVRLAALAASVVLIAFAGACQSSSGPADLLLAAGSFQLRAVNSSPLPYLDGTSYIVRGSLSIQTNARYTLSETDSSASGLSELHSTGTWSAPQGTVQFKDDNGTLYLGALSGSTDTINVTVGTHVSVYVRN
ncbi:MAG: hypothetical protein KGL93_08100 [Gemmatimonadota bacterium]|nr:hypothetical protein [Gemmatimonadota bacterium]HEU4989072.1 hypothetical protein [Gemmatimonadaceae bacterium]